jgi:Xaa-Pro dipeptidase
MEKDKKRNLEISQKIEEIRQIILKLDLKGILISRQYNVCWLTAGGNNHVLWDDQNSIIGILITKDKEIVIGENGDISRVEDEEFFNYPFEYKKYEWYSSSQAKEVIKISGDGRYGTDTNDPLFSEQINIDPYLSEYRSVFKPYEAERYKKYGEKIASIITDVCSASKPGITENDIAAMFASRSIKNNYSIFVQLLGSDERSLKYRHQVVTDKKISRHYSFCGVGRYQGFTYPINRIVSFGEPDKELVENNKKIEAVYVLLNDNARVGTNLKEVYEKLPDIYSAAGIEEEEWKNHSIGGTTGYLARENQLMDGVDYILRENNMIGWNPSLPGVMAEDVYWLKKDGIEYITCDKDWPSQVISIEGLQKDRPAILIL